MMPRVACLVLCLATFLTAAPIPAGTKLEIRLRTALNSASAKPKQQLQAVVIAPVVSGDSIVIGPGTKVIGHVKEVKVAQALDQQTVLDLAFDQLQDSNGKTAPIAARLVDIENARETVDEAGRIMGIVAAQTASARLDQGINKIAQKYPELGDLLGAAKQSVVKETDPTINYGPGVEMTLELTKPLDWTGDVPVPHVAPIVPAEELSRVVNSQPFMTRAERPPKPSDVTNLMFIGSQNDLERAFEAAGWSQAQQLNEQSKLETFRAIVELRGYKEAPVSLILLDDRPPDLVFEKMNNTFAARHHLRIWRRPGRFNGKDIWVCAATHDIGIDFSEQNHTFIHKIDSEIDRERAKVVNDLLFTGQVKGLSLVARPEVPTSGVNATGDPFRTDARMAILSF